jgi:transcriptional regulator with GAF, ATPase, and Fis domain
VSREHCRFVTDGGGGTQVEDLGSQNGTFVNGARIQGPRRLRPGDEIAVGDSLFVFDGDLEVAVARFGEATLVVTPGEVAAIAAPAPAPAAVAAALEAVRGLGRALGGARSSEAASEIVVQAMRDALAAERAFVLLGGHGGAALRPLAGETGTAAVAAVARPVLERAAAQRRAVVLDDAVGDPAVEDGRTRFRQRPRSVVVAPLLVGDQVAGYLYADRAGGGRFGAEHGALLDCFAAAAVLHGLGGALAPASPAAAAAVGGGGVVAASAAMKKVLDTVAAVARVASTVLVTGESGVGKEEVARLIHRSSARAGGPFVAVNCGAIAESLAESELFGHQKGAFTGASATQEGRIEAADQGTLFLDEIGELSPAIQVKLLRVLQERMVARLGSTVARAVDVRVVAATHRDLAADVKAGRFREDLFFRLDVIRVHIPPLRERPEDLAPLASALLARAAARLGRPDPGLDAGAQAALARARWPGNARELGNVLERALVLRAPGERRPLDDDEVVAAMGGIDPGPAPAAAAGEDTTLASKVAALERAEIVEALRRCRGVKARAAALLGVSRPTLDKKIADLDIDLWRAPGEAGAATALGRKSR